MSHCYLGCDTSALDLLEWNTTYETESLRVCKQSTHRVIIPGYHYAKMQSESFQTLLRKIKKGHRRRQFVSCMLFQYPT